MISTPTYGPELTAAKLRATTTHEITSTMLGDRLIDERPDACQAELSFRLGIFPFLSFPFLTNTI